MRGTRPPATRTIELSPRFHPDAHLQLVQHEAGGECTDERRESGDCSAGALGMAGDVDGDGFGDALVGDVVGHVWFYRGAPGVIPTSPALVLTPPPGAGAHFGASVL